MSHLTTGRFFLLVLLAAGSLALSGCNCTDPGFDRCVPTTCDDAGKNCGTIDDGCGDRINCGFCGTGYVCGLYEAGVCGSSGSGPEDGDGTEEDTNPLTGCRSSDCIDLGLECGTVGDGCGWEQTCGFCGGGMACGGGNEPGRCGQSVCTPTTCASVRAECGNYPDGCGGVLDCGSCDEEENCGGGGAYLCGTGTCTQNPSCADKCGLAPDGCGGVVLCPLCPGDQLCSAGRCIAGASSIGTPCSADSGCASGSCLTQYYDGWHSGYCTSPCGSDADCGEANVCGYRNENGSGICLIACSNSLQCRAGYVCAVPEGGSEQACIPGGTGNGEVGDPCGTGADCEGGPEGFCLRPQDGFPGGYCTLGCGDGGDCPEGSGCAFDSAGRGICVELCSSSEDCSGDYRCRDVGGFMACWPAGGLGDACLSHQDCGSEVCLSNEPHGWPGGYCTDLCASDAECGSGNQCLSYGPNGQDICVVGCGSNEDCRAGYACTMALHGGRVCLPYGGAGGGDDQDGPCEGSCSEAICTATTCTAAGAQCGSYPDGCGGALTCGGCADGQSCGGGGSYVCGTGCVPNLICGTRCGIVADGCSGVIQCASCGGDGICSANRCVPGADSIGNACAADSGCVSGHCLTEGESGWFSGYCTAPCGANADCGQGNVCGYIDAAGDGLCLDACSVSSECRDGYTCAQPPGGTGLACIPSAGMTCGEGDGLASCVSLICTPASCAAVGALCGRYPDGCGGVLFCGGCPTGESCGGGGPYVCGPTCVPNTSCAGRCGLVADGCSGTVVCPSCSGEELCYAGQCVDGADSIGDPCGLNSNCPSGHCLRESDIGWSEGYCTSPCGTSADCGEGNVCGFQNGNGSGICLTSCQASSECRQGYICALPPGGSEKACIPEPTEPDDGGGPGQIGDPCTTTQDCAGGEDAICVSTPAGGRCSIRCSTDQDCPSGSTCVTDGGVVPGFCQLTDNPIDNCSSDEDCGVGEVCVRTPIGRMCGKGCNYDRDCPTGTRCTTDGFDGVGFCQAVSPGGPGGGAPGSPCLFNDDCESGICIFPSMGYPGGYCAQPCTGNVDCAAGEICGPGGPGGQYICMPECATNRDCREGYVCVDMGGGRTACSPDRGDGVVGEACQTSEDCAAGHVCVETYMGNECKETCNGAGDCGDGMACRPIGDGLGTGTCEHGSENECSSDADCPPGKICGVSLTSQNLKCVDEEDGGVDWGWPTEDGWGGPRKTGDPCTLADQCERMQCLPERTSGWAEGYCTGTCSSNQDCSSGSICGLKRILEITAGSSGGFDIKDVTEFFGYEPGFGVTFQSSALSKLLIRMILKWLLDSLFGDYDGRVTIGQCLKSCSGDSECRSGYRCLDVDSGGVKGCIPFAGGPGAVGDACGLIPDCSGGMRGYCMMHDTGYPDGYCSLNCRSDPSVCPSGSRCVKLQDDIYTCMKTSPCNLQNLGAVCDWSRCEPNPSCWYWDDGWGWWRYDYDLCCDTGSACTPLVPCNINRAWECTAHRDHQTGFCSDCVGTERCRPDYACYSPDNGHGVCHPSAKGSRGIGQPCDRLRDCLYGVDGFCFEEAEGISGQPTTWAGGYCSKNCGSCPSGSHCSLLVTGGKYCLRSCSRNSDCRSGYTCEIVAKHRRVKRFKCRTTTYRACVTDDEIVDVQLSSSWLCSDPK